MKSMRRLGLVLTVLFLGIVIDDLGIRPALLVFVPLLTSRFMLWGEKRYHQSERRRIYGDHFYHEPYYRFRRP